ncbi:choice-of-anchor A family protein [Dyadobacter bucti]|uniref:choice-of-anchor A family protein n=1 Tax=Dyadobacter bucti TaxID=2572203 RepID=UPI0011087B6D|nr:choice-of-anchor A family protein [Dyadobacter bucti]
MSSKLLLISFLAASSFQVNRVQAQSPTSAARRFNIFVKGNATLTSSETEGPIAVGGNLTTNQYQISFNPEHGVFFTNNASIGLAVRGGVKLNNGSLTVNGNNYVKIGKWISADESATSLKVWYRDNNNAASTIRITGSNNGYSDTPNITINANLTTWNPNVSESVNPVFENIFGTGENQIDIDGAFTAMAKRSAQLATLKDNLAILDQNGNPIPGALTGPYLDPSVFGNNPKIKVNPNALNVLTVSAAVWNSIQNSNIEYIPAGPSLGQKEYTGAFGLVVNIVDFPAFASKNGNSIINFPGFGGLSDAQGSYVIYNFPDATSTITLGGNTPIHGTIFAPQADLIKENNGNINGQVIAKSFMHNRDEVHFWPFLPSIPEPSTSLPVTLASFTAQKENCNVNLKWKVTEATDFSHFMVQRSPDAKNFTSIARINYDADQKDYSFTDSPFSGENAPSKNYYYRLQQVDTDETFDYSTIRNVEAGQCDARLEVDFYPNPTQNELRVKSHSPVKMLEIFFMNGKQIYRMMLADKETEIKVDVQAFAQGMYIVSIVNGEGKYSSKLLKK